MLDRNYRIKICGNKYSTHQHVINFKQCAKRISLVYVEIDKIFEIVTGW